MKKLLAGLFLSILVLALAACGTDKKKMKNQHLAIKQIAKKT